MLIGEFSDQDAVNRACSLLEAQDVPVMVDHAERYADSGLERFYRVLVPVGLSQRSLTALSGLLPRFRDDAAVQATTLPRV